MGEIGSFSVKDVSICRKYMSVFIPKCKMVSIRRGIHPYLQGLIRLLAQFLLLRGYSSFFLHLLSHPPPSLGESLNLSLRSTFMLLKAFHTWRVERNLGNTLSHLLMTSPVTACIVSSLALLQILRVGVFLRICWTCIPAGNVPFQWRDTLTTLLMIA